MKTKICKVCGNEIPKKASVCPHCGAKSMSAWMGDKLVTCKKCGEQIAKSARVCPHCGKKQHQAAYMLCAVIIVFIFAFCALQIAFSSQNDHSPATAENAMNNSAQNTSDSAPSFEEIESEDLVFWPGTYVVGQDIAAGKYDCIAVSGLGVLRGDVASLEPTGLVQTMGESTSSIGGYSSTVEGSKSYNNLTLTDGDKIYIEMSLNVQFVPVE